ncbi:DUF1513 domain-containing protein [Denitrobaculum tricleocarpae]|uniref:DUF1513 domain-containing protein n=1 Tax=Denitrobaculum tricleocarpae TaxID=2591009 RepID=UPI0015D2BBD9|nr:DUF1513 domain-containing protein [Denitrobaculum tricleocarpae]
MLAEFALPERGHGAALRPGTRDAVIFARRPGTFALVLDTGTGMTRQLIPSRRDRHFYGHGCYSRDGAILFATENDFDGERGVIGLYDARDGYRRVGEFPCHGIGPHEMALMPDGRTLVVANGGILTHPDAPRMKLNLAEMAPSIAFIDATSGDLLLRHTPPDELRQLSLRHLSVRGDGCVAAVAQWEGAVLEQPPLIALLDRDTGLRFQVAPPAVAPRMRNYCGSVAFSKDGERFAVSSPRGGLITIWGGDGNYREAIALEDGCGLAAGAGGFVFTSGRGVVTSDGSREMRRHEEIAFDNHLIALNRP